MSGASAAPVADHAAASSSPAPGQPRLTVLAGLSTAVYALREGDTVVGRSSETDWQLRHPEISRRHCRFTREDTLVLVEDLASRWGTRVNGAVLASETRAPLQPGDQVQVGPVLLHYGLEEPPGDLLDRAAESAVDFPPHGPAALVTGAAALRGPQIIYRGQAVGRVSLVDADWREPLTLGRDKENGVVLPDPSISRRHAVVEPLSDGGFCVTDLHSRLGTLVNGRRFERHRLVIGDQIQLGPFYFRFDGRALERTGGLSGVEVEALHLSRRVGPTVILDDVSLRVDRHQFVAILGPSGSGKSSLLDALTGLRPCQQGAILFDGTDFYRHYDQLRSLLGYVPQDDIVHPELTVRQALTYSARLRLPARTPRPEIAELVRQTTARLGLDARAETPVARLSGGQRKRVSVGVELLGHPAVLCLDEPTSGLDPASEFKLMELLRHLADGGCTVICTTHVVENVYLTDQVFVVAGGRLVFGGGVQEAREHFGVQKLNMLYDRLEERPSSEWRERYQPAVPDGDDEASPPAAASPGEAGRARAAAAAVMQSRPRFKGSGSAWSQLVTLLARQWAIMSSDWRFFAILLGQPAVIGLLVAWISNKTWFTLFFAYLSTLWFGCSNAAQEIVRERPVYRRERMVGLSRHAYLLSKFVVLTALTVAQAATLYLLLRWLGREPDPHDDALLLVTDGSPWWQLGALGATAFASVGIGLAVSALARQTMQAVMVVPLVLIPQIVFSGLVFPADQMSTPVLVVSHFSPSFSAQTMMDTSLLWEQPIADPVLSRHRESFNNLRRLLRSENQPSVRTGEVFLRGTPGSWALAKLLAWGLVGYAVAWFALRSKERG